MDKEVLIQSIMNEVLMRLNHLEERTEIFVIGSTHHIQSNNKVLFTVYEGQNTPRDKNLLITHLSMASLSAIALGGATCETDEQILKALLDDWNVYLLEDGLVYKAYKKQNYNPLYSHYMQCENKLRQFGIKIIKSPYEILNKEVLPMSQVSPTKSIQSQIEHTPDINTIDLTHAKLLRESDIMRAQPMTIITVQKNCIITPLAQDRIQSYQLKIKRI